jgi:hypothetical protein
MFYLCSEITGSRRPRRIGTFEGRERMRLEFRAEGGELLIRLDAGGLAALMRAIQRAMESGSARLPAEAEAGGASFRAVTLTFAPPRSPAGPGPGRSNARSGA